MLLDRFVLGCRVLGFKAGGKRDSGHSGRPDVLKRVGNADSVVTRSTMLLRPANHMMLEFSS